VNCPASKVFEFLFNKHTKPDDVFGTYSITALEYGRLERVTDRYLPTAEVAFLDEIFKATGETLNALLVIPFSCVFLLLHCLSFSFSIGFVA